MSSISASASLPTGTIINFAGSTAPNGWALCDGSAISRTTFSSLFSVVGTTYGAGDGSTTFNLPDCRGRTLVGKDDMGGSAANRITTAGSGVDGVTLGAAGGSQNHVLTTAQLPANNMSSGNYDPAGTSGRLTKVSVVDGSGNTTGGSGSAHNNTQPSIIVNTIIKT